MEHELSIYRLCHKAAPKEVEVGEVEAVEVEEVEVEVEVGEAEAAEAEEGALSEEVVEEWWRWFRLLFPILLCSI